MKINYDDVAYIFQYKKKHFGEKYFCNHYIKSFNSVDGRIECIQKWWSYILLFIPVHILVFFNCILFEGICNFRFEDRIFYSIPIVGPGGRFERLKEVYEMKMAR